MPSVFWTCVDQYVGGQPLPLEPGAICRLGQFALPEGEVNAAQAVFDFAPPAGHYVDLELRFAVVSRPPRPPQYSRAQSKREPFEALDARYQERFFGYEFQGRQGFLFQLDTTLKCTPDESLIVDVFNGSRHILAKVGIRVHVWTNQYV